MAENKAKEKLARLHERQKDLDEILRREIQETQSKERTSSNRDKVVNEFVQHLTADGAAGEVVSIYKAMGDGCYCAFAAGKMAAQRMELEGEIKADQVFEIAMEFAKIIAMKITLAPQASALAWPQRADLGNMLNLGDAFREK